MLVINKTIPFILLIKYLFILMFVPELELNRFLPFFQNCNFPCLNPYKDLDKFEFGALTFPYGYVMYYFLLPFFKLSKLIDVSFIILTYIFVEVTSIHLLKKIFEVDYKDLFFPIFFNPLIIYSVVKTGFLDFITLFFLLCSLYFLRHEQYFLTSFFLALSSGTKIVLFLVAPLFFLIIFEFSKKISILLNSFLIFITLVLMVYLPIFYQQDYYQAVFRGITEGIQVLQLTGIFNLDTLLVTELLILLIYYFFWKNSKKLDYFGFIISLGFCTFPLFILNFSNPGWFLWTIPSILFTFITIEISRKILIYFYFVSLVVLDFLINSQTIVPYLKVAQFLFSLIILKYFYKFLIQNKYFRIKSQPIVLSVTGDSGVGKSTISNILSTFFGIKNTTIIEIDNYHLYERDSEIWKLKTHLNPITNNLSEFKKQLIEIISGNEELIREYNHSTGKFDDIVKMKKNQYMIIEGLHSLFLKDINNLYNLKIFLDFNNELKNKFKFERDVKRNRSPKKIKEQIIQRKEDYEKFIAPQKQNADITISTLEIDELNILLEITFPTEFFNEIERIIKDNNAEVFFSKVTHNKSEIKFKTSKVNLSLCKQLTESMKNFSDNSFYFHENEFYIKASIIIFFLSKNLEKI